MQTMLKKQGKAGFITAELLRELNEDGLVYLDSFIDLRSAGTRVIDSDLLLEEEKKNISGVQNMICSDSLNCISSLNEFISEASHQLPIGGLLAGKFYPKEIHKKNMRQSCNNYLQYKLAYFANFLCNAVSSKFKLIRRLYKKSSRDKEKINLLPFAEMLGRIAAGGFAILDYKQSGNYIYFIGRKEGEPLFDCSISDGAIFKMKRMSEGGKVKEFYKFRTMFKYAEYLQNFVYQRNGLQSGDKLNDDFRVTKIGNFLRKYWIDELPMLINLLKGDLKVVGVRPLSVQKFNLYTKTMQEYRTRFKPGLVPPYYADMPESLDEVMDSEFNYLKAYEKHPILTDVKYLFKAMYNIILKNARSQ